MRIALLTWNYLPFMAGGTEIASQHIARYLASRGHEVLVVTTRDAGLPKEGMEEGFCVYRARSLKFKPFKYAFFCFRATLVLRRFKPDVIHAQAMWMGLPALIAKTVIKRPYLIWVQGSDIYFPRLFKGPISKLVLSAADAVIALTKDMKTEIQKICRRDILVIANGIDPVRFEGLSREEACRRLQIENKGEVVVFVGTLSPVKGVRYLIEGMKIVNRECPTARLFLVGDGVEKQSLEELANRLNVAKCITFIGRVDNERVPEYMGASDVFVLPSLSEGFPVVILEAMASGLPIVTTNVRGLPEIVNDGENGFLVYPENPAQLAERIILLLKDKELREKLSANNRAKAKEYSWDNVVAKLEEAYSTIG